MHWTTRRGGVCGWVLAVSCLLAGSPGHAVPAPDRMMSAAGGTVTTFVFGNDGNGGVVAQPFSVEASPLWGWKATGAAAGRPVLIVQGLMLNSAQPTPDQVYDQVSGLAEAVRKSGRDVWILSFSTPLAPIAAQALAVSDAVSVVSREAGGSQIDLIGLSSGGLAARYALAGDEAAGRGSNGLVASFATVDTPHQGANLQVAAQASLWLLPTAASVLRAPAMQNMLSQWVRPKGFQKTLCSRLLDSLPDLPGLPIDATIQSSTEAHDRFFAELTARNGDGYPHRTRNVALAGAAREPPLHAAGEELYVLTLSAELPLVGAQRCVQSYKARPLDVLPGSVLPPEELFPSHGTVTIGGVTVELDLQKRFNPTLVSVDSALDATRTPSPFVATWTPKSGVLTHGDLPEEGVQFLLAQLRG